MVVRRISIAAEKRLVLLQQLLLLTMTRGRPTRLRVSRQLFGVFPVVAMRLMRLATAMMMIFVRRMLLRSALLPIRVDVLLQCAGVGQVILLLLAAATARRSRIPSIVL